MVFFKLFLPEVHAVRMPCAEPHLPRGVQKYCKIIGNISFFEFSFGPLLAPTWAGSFSSFILIAYSGLMEIIKSIIKPIVFCIFFARGARLEMRRVGDEASQMQGKCKFGTQRRPKHKENVCLEGKRQPKRKENICLEWKSHPKCKENVGLEREKDPKRKENVGLEPKRRSTRK